MIRVLTMKTKRLPAFLGVLGLALVGLCSAFSASADGQHVGHKPSVLQYADSQRVIVHALDITLDVNGEQFEFQSTTAEGYPAAVTVGKDGLDYAYRLELLTNPEAKTSAGDVYLPIEIKLFLEEQTGRTMLKDSSMGIKIGTSASMQSQSEYYSITLSIDVGAGEETWVGLEDLAKGQECFSANHNLFDEDGRPAHLMAQRNDDAMMSQLSKNESGMVGTEHILPDPECCHYHCFPTWTICCGAAVQCCDCLCCQTY